VSYETPQVGIKLFYVHWNYWNY